MVVSNVNFAVVGTEFRSSVSIDLSLLVARLRKAVKTEDPENIACGTMSLQLFLAKRASGDWLSAGTELANAAIGERGRLKLDADGHVEVFEPMKPLQSLNDPKYFGANFESRAGQIHVLVVVPKKLWLVTASIANALEAVGIRARVYEATTEHVGFYDSALQSDGQDRAFWYEEDKSLRIHVLFDTKENARRLETFLRNCQMLMCSPLKGHTVTTTVEEVFSVESQPLQRIFYEQYDPKETTSPQQSMVMSLSCSDLEAHLLDISTAEFRYQRIEDERFFIPHCKAECCNLVPGKEWKEVMQYGKYDDDPNNRLALSRLLRRPQL
ncbi:hypothetical protein PR003_g2991 [Phytophthora rubi]|uniref:Crinkler effector protein N-terminal domain-containing protein n=1 Tax=Phytophthora rubi TaxID=129364 RepID=A0A6A4G240_9STRA|nr:hypothetical protein PR002_g2796 [Phytophthora rubi]KAE9049936.1 hypothetical protein PR001_g2852 [Phytophthora rubi]KAE9355169.1 hypothetical protein PR003_g2991 [Phytophthora rubi]